eukprot:TRINITY_DN12181_c0_g1_i1.p1 TRINITY_DN12181_c0_g1~~TRINITY_DN12181_c0_g1_i1.p1  ORF type:complete len:365 (+),score=49.00 TRINITY_DN12181_c0_g1_i1:1-1095(+)
MNITRPILYREIIFALLGYVGEIINDEFKVVENIPFLQIQEINIINETLIIGCYYKKISTFIDNINSNMDKNGMYLKSLSHGIEDKLLIQYRKKLKILQKDLSNENSLSILYIETSISEFRILFSKLLLFIQVIEEKKIYGSQLLSILYQMKNCGILEVKNLFEDLISQLHIILYNQIISWIFKGELIDKYEEFFIIENSKDDTSDQISFDIFDSFSKSDKFGSEIFNIRSAFLPSYISTKMAEEILFIGRASRVLSPKEQINEYTEFESIFKIKNLDLFEFEKVLMGFKNLMSQKLWKLIVIDNQLALQIKLIREYFLLGDGEYYRSFLDENQLLFQSPSINNEENLDVINKNWKSCTSLLSE